MRRSSLVSGPLGGLAVIAVFRLDRSARPRWAGRRLGSFVNVAPGMPAFAGGVQPPWLARALEWIFSAAVLGGVFRGFLRREEQARPGWLRRALASHPPP